MNEDSIVQPEKTRVEKPPVSPKEPKREANLNLGAGALVIFIICVVLTGGFMSFCYESYKSSVAPVPIVAEDYAAPTFSLVEDYTKARVGERFNFGRYPQGANGEVEPITWRVLKRDSEGLLVISEKCLDVKPYNEKYEPITWAECTLRRWLNDDFVRKAFNDQEQSLIKTSSLVNNAGPSTEDRVFLLSEDEAKNLFADDKYANCSYWAWWWLRSRRYDLSSAAYVNPFGGIYNDYAYGTFGCVRPAFRLAL